MLKLVNSDKKREDEETKQETKVSKKHIKTTPAEIRWRKELIEIDLPSHVNPHIDELDIMKFSVTIDLTNEE